MVYTVTKTQFIKSRLGYTPVFWGAAHRETDGSLTDFIWQGFTGLIGVSEEEIQDYVWRITVESARGKRMSGSQWAREGVRNAARIEDIISYNSMEEMYFHTFPLQSGTCEALTTADFDNWIGNIKQKEDKNILVSWTRRLRAVPMDVKYYGMMYLKFRNNYLKHIGSDFKWVSDEADATIFTWEEVMSLLSRDGLLWYENRFNKIKIVKAKRKA